VNRLIATVYRDLIKVVVNAEFPHRRIEQKTRMAAHTPRGVYAGKVIDATARAVSVGIARAGLLPAQVCFEALAGLLDPAGVRQDILVLSRETDRAGKVTGVAIGGSKIGGDKDGRFILIPDPMGATGASVSTALSIYKGEVPGTAVKFIILHLIVTPEYLWRLQSDHPDTVVYAIRLDRGLSSAAVLQSPFGRLWTEERGLNEQHYIVPGGGGFGEVLYNAEK